MQGGNKKSLSKASRYQAGRVLSENTLELQMRGEKVKKQWTADSINSLLSSPRSEWKCYVHYILAHWFMASSVFCFVQEEGRGIVIIVHEKSWRHATLSKLLGLKLLQTTVAEEVCSFEVRWANSTLSVWVFPKAELSSMCTIVCGRFWKKPANVGNSRGIFYNLSPSAITQEACQGHLISMRLC